MVKRFLLCWIALAVFGVISTSSAQAPASVTSPANGSILSGASQLFQWNDAGASLYQVWVGTSMGAYDLGYFPAAGTTSTSATVTGLPVDGRTLYVTLWSAIDGTYYSSASMYMATSSGGSAASITSPANGAMLSGSTQLFQWNAAPVVMLYQLWVGTTPGAYDVGYFPMGGTTGTTVTATGLPTDGRTLYVRLYSLINGAYQFHDFTYTSASSSASASSITSPADGSMLAGATQLFEWDDAGATYFQLWVGNTPGAYDIGYFPAAGTADHSVGVSGLPTDGRTLYVRLYSMVGGAYQFRDFTYVAATVAMQPFASEITSPTQGASLFANSDTFQWNPGADGYQIWLGSTPGGYDIGYFPSGLTTDTRIDVTGLPNDGRTVYVRLWSLVDDAYNFRDSSYVASAPLDARWLSPADGSMLPGPSQTFEFAASIIFVNVTVGSELGGSDLGSASSSGLGDATVRNLPIDGRPLFVRATWTNGGIPRFRDRMFFATPPGPGAVLLSPANDAILFNVPPFTFTWSDVGATSYMLWVGYTTGGQEIASFTTTGTTASVTAGLPRGAPATARLWSLIDGVWYYRDYVFGTSAA